MADDAMRDVSTGYPLGTRLGGRVNFEKVSWAAIWAGAMITLGMEVLFLSFGVFIEGAFAGSVDWAMAWYLVTMAVSFYTGAWSAARLSNVSMREICALHGLATWGLATLTTAIVGGVFEWAYLTREAAASHGFVWGHILEYGGVIWGGVMLSLITAYLGGSSAVPSQPAVQEREIPSAPMRRAS